MPRETKPTLYQPPRWYPSDEDSCVVDWIGVELIKELPHEKAESSRTLQKQAVFAGT